MRILAKYFPLTRVIVNFITLLGVNKVVKTRRDVIKYLRGMNWLNKQKVQLMSNRKKRLSPNETDHARLTPGQMQRIKVINFDNRF